MGIWIALKAITHKSLHCTFIDITSMHLATLDTGLYLCLPPTLHCRQLTSTMKPSSNQMLPSIQTQTL
jgi:hypothetical protein